MCTCQPHAIFQLFFQNSLLSCTLHQNATYVPFSPLFIKSYNSPPGEGLECIFADVTQSGRCLSFSPTISYIIVQDGDPTKTIWAPDGFDYQLYNRNDVNRVLGPKLRGYPFSLREGVPTAISILTWTYSGSTFLTDYDAPTQLVKPPERNTRKRPSHSSNLLSSQKDAPLSTNATYTALSKQVKDKLGPVDPYFHKLGDAMLTWIEAWDELN
ncbi:hypothetical protein Q3G72_016428 [Acer saccharum]|nr:hypothetical protein Q3G72_016428 [Acer saccharum]